MRQDGTGVWKGRVESVHKGSGLLACINPKSLELLEWLTLEEDGKFRRRGRRRRGEVRRRRRQRRRR